MKISGDTRGILIVITIAGFIFGMMWIFKSASKLPTDHYTKEETSPQIIYSKAKTLYTLGNHDAALSMLTELITKHSENPFSDSARILKEVVSRAQITRDSIDSVQKATELEIQKKEREEALLHMTKKSDEFNGYTWYQDKTSPKYVDNNTLFGYIAVKDGIASLLFKIQYTGDDWLFIEKYIVLVDGVTYEIIENSYGEIETGNSGGQVWEWLNRAASDEEIKILQAISTSKVAKLRYQGKQYNKDRVIKDSEKQALKNVLVAYEALGGSLPLQN